VRVEIGLPSTINAMIPDLGEYRVAPLDLPDSVAAPASMRISLTRLRRSSILVSDSSHLAVNITAVGRIAVPFRR
jgi:hypothetical protein